jgi:hypothetical protein
MVEHPKWVVIDCGDISESKAERCVVLVSHSSTQLAKKAMIRHVETVPNRPHRLHTTALTSSAGSKWREQHPVVPGTRVLRSNSLDARGMGVTATPIFLLFVFRRRSLVVQR